MTKPTATEAIKLLMEQHFPEVEYMVIIMNEDKATDFSGNGCPVCALEVLVDWVDHNDIKHLSEVEDKQISQKVH